MRSEDFPKNAADNTINGVDRDLKVVAGGATLILAGKILGSLILYIYSIVIARLLGVQFFGLFMLGLTIINFLGIIGRLGLESGVVKFAAQYTSDNDIKRLKGLLTSALKYSFLFSLIIAAGLCLAASPLLAGYLKKPDLVNIVRILAVTLPLWAIMLVSLGFTQGLKIMKYYVVTYNLLWPAANLLLAVCLYYLGLKINAALWAQVLSVTLAAFLALYFAWKAIPGLRAVKGIEEPRRLFEVSVPLSFTFFLSFLASWTDTLMLGYFMEADQVGIYNAAARTALFTSAVLLSFNAIFGAVISELHNKGEIQKLETLLKIISRWVYTFSLAGFCCILLRAQAITGLFGAEFMAGAGCLMVLATGQMVNGSVGPVGLVLAMTGRHNFLMVASMIVCTANFFLNMILIPLYGILGAAVATALSVTVFNLIMVAMVFVCLGIHPYDFKYVRILLFGLISYAAVLIFDSGFPGLGNVAGLAWMVAIFGTVYSTMIFFFGSFEEDRLIFQLAKEKITNLRK